MFSLCSVLLVASVRASYLGVCDARLVHHMFCGCDAAFDKVLPVVVVVGGRRCQPRVTTMWSIRGWRGWCEDGLMTSLLTLPTVLSQRHPAAVENTPDLREYRYG